MSDTVAIRAVINEMIEIAAERDDSPHAPWTSENRDQIDQWQSRLAAALAHEE